MAVQFNFSPYQIRQMVLAVVFILSLSACFPPVNSTFESARTLGKGNIEVTGNYSYYNKNDNDAKANNFGIRLGLGIADNFDIKMRYEKISATGYENGINYFELSPKLSILKNSISALLPLGLYFDDKDHTFVLSPKIILTYPFESTFDISLSTKADFFLHKDTPDIVLGFNLGFGISTDLDNWAIRPEIGRMINPKESGYIWTYGIGFNYIFSTNKAR